MLVIEISERKLDKLEENTRKMFKHAGKVMECIEELREASGMGERRGGGYGNRNYDGYGNRGYNNGGYGNRHEEDDDDDFEDMGERRGVKGTGPYGRRYR